MNMFDNIVNSTKYDCHIGQDITGAYWLPKAPVLT